MGTVHINTCNFGNGTQLGQFAMHGGGGVVVESSGSVLELLHSTYSWFHLTIINTNFSSNTASSGSFSSLPLNTDRSGYFALGMGGGLSVVFRERAANNTVQLTGVRLEGNTAQLGGGMFLAFYDNTSNNTVSIDDSEVTGNEAIMDIAQSNGGGGLFIAFNATEINWPFNNSATIYNSDFTSNEADYGGGIAVDVQNDQGFCFSTGNKLLIDKSVFNSNEAFQGSSAYFSQNRLGRQHLVDTVVRSSKFTNGHCGTSMRREFSLPCSGNIFIQNIVIVLMQTVFFTDNLVSALELHYSSIELSPGTQLQFINNSALKGAALHLVDCSTVIVNNSTALLLQNNTATDVGGAIYAESCNVHQTGGRQCFVRHAKSNLHPNYWETNFTFISNSGSAIPNSVYVDSIRPCIWPDATYGTDGTNSTFCWSGWSYMNSSGVEEDCLLQLKSAPAYVNSSLEMMTLYSGETVELQVTVLDDWHRDVTNESTINVAVISGHAYLRLNLFGNIQNFKRISLPPSHSHHVTLLANCPNEYSDQCSILSVGPPQLSQSIKMCFRSCDATPGSCCSSSLGCGLLVVNDYECDSNCFSDNDCPFTSDGYFCFCPYTSTISIYQMTCLSFENMTGHLLRGSCPSSYHPAPISTNTLIHSQLAVKQLIMSYQPLSSLSCVLHREGRLCGRCTEGYGVAFNSPDFICTPCESYNGIAVFLFLELLLVLIMMTILAVLHINITNGYLNGFVLYSQLVTLQFPGLGYPSWVLSYPLGGVSKDAIHINFGFITIYSIWNLNFLTLYPEPFCIPFADTAVRAIALQYVIAAFPLLFIALSYIWIQLYSRGNRSVVCITRPVHKVLARFWQKLKIQPSLIDTYAGLIILSYMRFANISVNLLQITYVLPFTRNSTEPKGAFYYDASLDYFGWPHAAYGVLAIVCLLVFVLPPIIVLLFYHLKIFQRLLSLCKLDRPGLHALVDAYQGCFKNSATDGVERRYTAGIYLLFRLYIIYYIFFSFQSFYISPLIPVLFLEIVLGLLMTGMIALLRPYEKTAHNVTDFILFFYMTMIAALSVIEIPLSIYHSYYLSINTLVYLPAFVLIVYLIYRMLRYCCHSFKCIKKKTALQQKSTISSVNCTSQPDLHFPLLVPATTSTIILTDYVADDLFADRVMNPSGYEEEHTQYQLVDEPVSQTDEL